MIVSYCYFFHNLLYFQIKDVCFTRSYYNKDNDITGSVIKYTVVAKTLAKTEVRAVTMRE